MCSSNSCNTISSSGRRIVTRPKTPLTDPQAAAGAPLLVTHDYHDFAQEQPADPNDATTADAMRASGNAHFPVKLFYMLQDIHANGNGDTSIISWQPHGRCFVVHKPDKFVALLPHYFKLSKLASFQRQLNLYGFTRLAGRGPDRGGYYHECFLRDRPQLLHRVTRTKIKGTHVRARANPTMEPDFWQMEFVGSTTGGGDCQPDETAAPLPCTAMPSGSLVSNGLVSDSKDKVVCEQQQQQQQQQQPQQQLQPQQPLFTYSSHKDLDSVSSTIMSSSTMSLSAWGMPFTYLSRRAAAAAVTADTELTESPTDMMTDEGFFKQTIQDLLVEDADTLLADTVGSSVAV